MLWGSDELGIPPLPRCAPQDEGGQSSELMHAAAGHMYATGMRLAALRVSASSCFVSFLSRFIADICKCL